MVQPVDQQPPHWQVSTAHNALFLLQSKLYSLHLQHFPVIESGESIYHQRHFGKFVSKKLSIVASVAPK